MARTGITQEQVFDTAERLRAEPQPVNVESVSLRRGCMISMVVADSDGWR